MILSSNATVVIPTAGDMKITVLEGGAVTESQTFISGLKWSDAHTELVIKESGFAQMNPPSCICMKSGEYFVFQSAWQSQQSF